MVTISHPATLHRFIVPILIVAGICGSLANLAIMSGAAFTGSTFYYLRALSLCDMFYLLCVIGTLSSLHTTHYIQKLLQVMSWRCFCSTTRCS